MDTQLTLSARKGIAIGLALSTILWATMLWALPVFVSAAAHSDGCLINSAGTIYLLTGGQKRGFPTGEVLVSHGYNFGQVVSANSEDTQPVGSVMVYADGTLVKGPSDPLVYLVANGQKRGFVSGSVYTGLGYSFANVVTAAVNTFADLPTGANLESASERHTSGVLVKDSTNTIWQMTATGRKGVPSMDVFNSYGFSFAKVVTANAADLSAANEGVLTARASCSGGGSVPVSGALSVSLASSNPAATSIISDSDGAQAQAPMLAVNFSAGSSSSTVTTVKVKRAGISANSDVSNVYLYDGNTRLAEFTSYADGVAVFTNSSGLFTVPGGSTRVITVKMDLPNSTSSGKTIGFDLTEVALSGGAAVSGLPLRGNLMTTATVTDLGKLDITNFTTFPGTADPGQTALEVWRFNLTSSDQDIEVSKINLTMVGTIAIADVQNVKLMVGGVQVGSTQQISSTNEVTFDLSSSPYKITSGNVKTVTVNADIVGGTNRAFKFTIRKVSDVVVRDLNYGVWIKPLVSGAAFTIVDPDSSGDGTNINSGKLTVSRSADSPSTNVALAATGVTLAKFDLKATGEAVKIEQITVETIVAGGSDTTLDNGKLFLNGSQIGSTTDLDADTSSDSNFTDSGNDDDTAYTLGNTLIIPAGSTYVVSVVVDTKDGNGGTLDNTSVLVKIQPQTVTGQVSLATISPASANGNTLTFSSGALTTAKNLAVADATSTTPTGVAGATNVRIGSFTATAGTGEGVSVTQVVIKDDLATSGDGKTLADAFQNLLVKINGVQVGSTIATLTDTDSTTYSFSVSPAVQIAAGGQAVIDVYADILSSISVSADINSDSTNSGAIILLDTLSATGITTGTDACSASACTTDREGQDLYIASAGTFSVTADSASPASTLVAGTGTELEVARFTLKETAGAEGIRITQVVVTDSTAGGASPVTSAFSSVKLFIDGVQVGSTQNLSAAANGTATFSGLSYTVPANTTKTLVVKATPGVYPNGTSNSDHNFQLAASAITASGAVSNTATNGPAVAVTSNTHSWARTSLAATGAAQGALTSRVRTATDKLLSLTFTSGSPYQAALRGSLQANDEAITNWATNDADATVALTSSFAVDGTNSVQAVSAANTAMALAYDFGASAGLNNYSRISAWVNVVGSAAAGAVTFAVDNTALLASPTGTPATVATASTTATWYYVDITTASQGADASSQYVGVKAAAAGGTDTVTVRVDNLRFYNDSLVIDVSGNLKATKGSHTKKVELKDGSGVVKAVGYLNTTTQDVGTATLLVGDDAGNAERSLSADINFSTSASTYDVYLSSIDHVLVDAGAAAEALTLNVDLGNATTSGDVSWYDGVGQLTWVNGTTPIQASVSYQ